MRKLLFFFIASCLLLNANAQFPFALGSSFSKAYIEERLSIAVPYSSTTARLHVRGTGATAGTTAFYVEDNGGSGMMATILDDGSTIIRTDANVRYLFGGSNTLSFTDDAGIIRNQTIRGATLTWDYTRHTTSNLTLNPASTTNAYFMSIVATGSDASGVGSNTLRVMELKPTWNLTVASPADVVGIDYNPTVTSIFGQHYAALFRSGRVGIGTATPTSTFHQLGSQAYSAATVTTTTTAGEHYTILVDCTAGAVTINLPAVASCSGRTYIIKKIDVSGNIVTIDGNAAETIDGTATKTLSNQYNYYAVQNDGSAWYIVGNN